MIWSLFVLRFSFQFQCSVLVSSIFCYIIFSLLSIVLFFNLVSSFILSSSSIISLTIYPFVIPFFFCWLSHFFAAWVYDTCIIVCILHVFSNFSMNLLGVFLGSLIVVLIALLYRFVISSLIYSLPSSCQISAPYLKCGTTYIIHVCKIFQKSTFYQFMILIIFMDFYIFSSICSNCALNFI